MTKKRMVLGVVVGLVVAVCSASSGVAAGASPERPVQAIDLGGQGYVALGDSIAFGFTPLLEDPWVPEQFVGYPELIGDDTGAVVTNLACPGQTAQALVSFDALDNGCFDARQAFDEAGLPFLHQAYDGTQLQAALDAVESTTPPALITIQGGGNEVSFCGGEPDPSRCLAENLPRITDSLRVAVNQLRAAGYEGRVVLVGYHLVPGLESPLRRVNRAIERTARTSSVSFADVAIAFERYAHRHHADLCGAKLLVELPDGSCDLHPSPRGHQLYASAVLDALP